MILVPMESKGNAFLSNGNVIEKNNRIGIKGVLIKNVHSKSCARKIVIICDYGVLIECVRFKACKLNQVFAKCEILFGYYAISVKKDCFKCAARKCDKIIVILNVHFK